jgi:hypothetical protein
VTQDFVEPWCERYLAEYVSGAHGLLGVIDHPEHVRISVCLREVIQKHSWPLRVAAAPGNIVVSIDREKLSAAQREMFDAASVQAADPVLSELRPLPDWPLGG